jgi:uroporphyrinogen-III decarboxylase
MTSKERILTALHKGKPDRLPVTAHQWQGYHLDKYMDGISDLEAFQQLGMDAQVQYFPDMGQFWLVDADYTKTSTPEWRDEVTEVSKDPDQRINHHTIHTPGGTLTYKTAGDRKTTWITEYLIKRDEDVELISKYMPVPTLDKAPLADLYEELGDHGIMRGFVWGDQAGCWQHAACLMDITDLIFATADKPGWVRALLDALLEKKLRFIEGLKGAKFDVIETGGGAASSTVISPDLHREFCLPYDRQLHEALHEHGFLVSYHTCGGTFGLEESIVENGCDISETLAPVSIGGNQEPWEFAGKIDGRLALIGGIDQFSVVGAEVPDNTIRQKVHETFEKTGKNGGYVCSLSDHFFETPVEKLETYVRAAHECVY